MFFSFFFSFRPENNHDDSDHQTCQCHPSQLDENQLWKGQNHQIVLKEKKRVKKKKKKKGKKNTIKSSWSKANLTKHCSILKDQNLT